MSDQFVQGDTAVGPGEAPPLPEGQAKALNDAQTPAPEPQTPPTASPPPASPSPDGQEPAPIAEYKPQPGDFGMDKDELAYLFGPTENPGEPVHAGVLSNGNVAPPPETYQYLGALRNALADPTAGPGLHLLAQLVAEQLP